MNFEVAKINPTIFSFWGELPNNISKEAETKLTPRKKVKDMKHKVTPDGKGSKNKCLKFIGNSYKSNPLIKVADNIEVLSFVN